MAYAYNPRTREVETGGLLGHTGQLTYPKPWIPASERFWLKKKKIKTKKGELLKFLRMSFGLHIYITMCICEYTNTCTHTKSHATSELSMEESVIVSTNASVKPKWLLLWWDLIHFMDSWQSQWNPAGNSQNKDSFLSQTKKTFRKHSAPHGQLKMFVGSISIR